MSTSDIDSASFVSSTARSTCTRRNAVAGVAGDGADARGAPGCETGVEEVKGSARGDAGPNAGAAPPSDWREVDRAEGADACCAAPEAEESEG